MGRDVFVGSSAVAGDEHLEDVGGVASGEPSQNVGEEGDQPRRHEKAHGGREHLRGGSQKQTLRRGAQVRHLSMGRRRAGPLQ